MSTHCPVHNAPWKTVPAGFSKTKFDEFGNPKAYRAFQACPIQGCDQRPPKGNGQAAQTAPTAQQAASTPQPRPQVQNSAEARLRAASAAWSAACAYYAGQPSAIPGFVESMAAAGYQFILRAYQGQPVVSRQPGEDDDLNFGETVVG